MMRSSQAERYHAGSYRQGLGGASGFDEPGGGGSEQKHRESAGQQGEPADEQAGPEAVAGTRWGLDVRCRADERGEQRKPE